MDNSKCIITVEKILAGDGFRSLDSDTKGWIAVYCKSGFDSKWIATRLFRLLTLDAFLEDLINSFPLLTESELDILKHEYLSGKETKRIKRSAKELSKRHASEASSKSIDSTKPPSGSNL